MEQLKAEFRYNFFSDPKVRNSDGALSFLSSLFSRERVAKLSRRLDKTFDKASAWYCASYEKQDNDNRSFPWVIYDVVLSSMPPRCHAVLIDMFRLVEPYEGRRRDPQAQRSVNAALAPRRLS